MTTPRICGTALFLIGLLFSVQASAQLNGHNLRGDFGLPSGSQPPPGSYLSPFYVNYDVGTLRDRTTRREMRAHASAA